MGAKKSNRIIMNKENELDKQEIKLFTQRFCQFMKDSKAEITLDGGKYIAISIGTSVDYLQIDDGANAFEEGSDLRIM